VNIFATVKVSMVFFPIVMDMINSGKFDPSNLTSILFQLAKTALPLWVITRLVLLLNLPFAMGALMYGYESLFGSRETGAA
jgi:hypothetical protein